MFGVSGFGFTVSGVGFGVDQCETNGDGTKGLWHTAPRQSTTDAFFHPQGYDQPMSHGGKAPEVRLFTEIHFGFRDPALVYCVAFKRAQIQQLFTGTLQEFLGP